MIKVSKSHIADNKYQYTATLNDEITVGGFEASINRSEYRNICILDYGFANSFQQEILGAFAKEMLPLSVYIKTTAFEENCVARFGLAVATEAEIDKTIWWNHDNSGVTAVYRIIPTESTEIIFD